MTIKKQMKKMAAGAMLMTAFAMGSGCNKNGNQEEANSKIVNNAKTCQEPSQKDYEYSCNKLSGKGTLADYDAKKNVCYVLENNKVIDADINPGYYLSQRDSSEYAKGLCGGSGEGTVVYKSKDGKTVAEFGCHFTKNCESYYYHVIVTFTNVVPLCEDLAEQCKKDKDCKCETKKDENGCVKCEKQVRGTVVVKKQQSAQELDEVAMKSFDFHGEYVGNQEVHTGWEIESKKAQLCDDDKSKYCVRDHNITFKFNDVQFITDEMYDECVNDCAEDGGEPYVEREDFDGNCLCNVPVTDEMYDNCKIKCVEQGSVPASKREDFDGNCECKKSGESASLKQAKEQKLAMVHSMLNIKCL